MKKKILLALVAVMVFGLAIAGFAYTKSNHSNHDAHKAACACCKDGACPMMKDKTADGAQQHTDCCDSEDCCCKKGDACPMKKQKETATQENVDMKNVTVVSSGEDCCQPGADCCKNGGGACCKKKS